jgi:hypothetical protein
MTDKKCPRCGQTWQDGNFCPVDGTKLLAVVDPGAADATTGEMPVQARPFASDAGAADTDATVMEMGAIPASLAAEWLAARRAGPVADPAARTAPDAPAQPARPGGEPAPADTQRTRVELEAVPMSAVERAESRPRVEVQQKKLGDTALDRIAERIKSEVARERPITSSGTERTPAVRREAAREAPVAQKPTVEKRAVPAPDSEFSETQWFLKALEVDADLLDVVDESEYKRSDKVPEALRRRMTLRKKDED